MTASSVTFSSKLLYIVKIRSVSPAVAVCTLYLGRSTTLQWNSFSLTVIFGIFPFVIIRRSLSLCRYVCRLVFDSHCSTSMFIQHCTLKLSSVLIPIYNVLSAMYSVQCKGRNFVVYTPKSHPNLYQVTAVLLYVQYFSTVFTCT